MKCRQPKKKGMMKKIEFPDESKITTIITVLLNQIKFAVNNLIKMYGHFYIFHILKQTPLQ